MTSNRSSPSRTETMPADANTNRIAGLEVAPQGAVRQRAGAGREVESALLRRHRHEDPNGRRVDLSGQPDRTHAARQAVRRRAAQGRRREALSRHAGREGRCGGGRCAVPGGRDGGEGQRPRAAPDVPHQRRRYRRGGPGASDPVCSRDRQRGPQALPARARQAGSAGHARALLRPGRIGRRGRQTEAWAFGAAAHSFPCAAHDRHSTRGNSMLKDPPLLTVRRKLPAPAARADRQARRRADGTHRRRHAGARGARSSHQAGGPRDARSSSARRSPARPAPTTIWRSWRPWCWRNRAT